MAIETVPGANISAETLFQSHLRTLHWQWIAGRANPKRRFSETALRQAHAAADLIGHLNFIHPYRVHVLGRLEAAYLQQSRETKGERVHERVLSRIVAMNAPALIIADGQQAPPGLPAMCDQEQIPLFITKEPAAQVIELLRAYLAKRCAIKITLHGVYMDIFSLGVLLTGESGLGKSELGLELISRGHGLIADDMVDFARISHHVVEGRCPGLIENLLEVRGIGLLDIKAIFGEAAVRRHMRLRLIVHLVRADSKDPAFERLPSEPLTQEVLGVPIRKVIIQVGAGRNLAVLVEAAVRNAILQLRGINVYEEFTRRQTQAMAEDDPSEA